MDEQFADSYTVEEDCKVTVFVGGIPAVVAYFTNNRSETRGMSVIPGTNVTFLTVRK